MLSFSVCSSVICSDSSAGILGSSPVFSLTLSSVSVLATSSISSSSKASSLSNSFFFTKASLIYPSVSSAYSICSANKCKSHDTCAFALMSVLSKLPTALYLTGTNSTQSSAVSIRASTTRSMMPMTFKIVNIIYLIPPSAL